MERLALASSTSPVLLGSPNPVEFLSRRGSFGPALPLPAMRGNCASRRRRTSFAACSLRNGGRDGASSQRVLETGKAEMQNFASISSSNDSGTSTVFGSPQFRVPSPPPYIGSPLLWIGVGIGLSATFSVVATKFKRRAIQQAFKAVMVQEAPQDGQFNNDAFSPGSPFPFPSASPSAPTPVASKPAAAENVSATKIEATPQTEDKDKTVINKEARKHGDAAATPVASQPAAVDNAPPTKVAATPPTEEKNKTGTNNRETKHVAAGGALATKVNATQPAEDRNEIVADDKEAKHGEKPPKSVASPQVATKDAPAANAEATPSTEDKGETNKQ